MNENPKNKELNWGGGRDSSATVRLRGGARRAAPFLAPVDLDAESIDRDVAEFLERFL